MRKNRGKIVARVMVLIVVLIGIALLGYTGYNRLVDKYSAKITDLNKTIEANKQSIYVASRYIVAGETLDPDENVVKQNVVSGIDSYLYIDASDLGKQAVVDIDEGTPIMTNMISSTVIADDTRTYDTATVVMMADQSDYDVVDIRIVFPNGEDFLLLSKKTVSNVDHDNCRFNMILNEEELLRFKCALVDAYCITGTKLYTVRYIEPSVQEAGIPNYPVRDEIIALMQSDPNVVTYAEETLNVAARIDLEGRLQLLTEDQLNASAAGNQVTDTANSSVLLLNKELKDGFTEVTEEKVTDVTVE